MTFLQSLLLDITTRMAQRSISVLMHSRNTQCRVSIAKKNGSLVIRTLIEHAAAQIDLSNNSHDIAVSDPAEVPQHGGTYVGGQPTVCLNRFYLDPGSSKMRRPMMSNLTRIRTYKLRKGPSLAPPDAVGGRRPARRLAA